MKAYRILHLDDNEHDARIIQRHLKHSNVWSDYKVVDDKMDFLRALVDFDPQVVLADNCLPSYDSQEALEHLHLVKPQTPFILVTGTMDEEMAADTLKNGVDDYVLKSDLPRLPRVILNAVLRKEACTKSLDQHEDHLKALTETLEIKVMERTAQLQESVKDLEAFSYSVSHDLKTPLRSVKGFAQLLLDKKAEKLDAESKEFLYHISTSAGHMSQLVEDLLKFSRFNHQPLEKKTVNVNQLVAEVIAETKQANENFAAIINVHPLPAATADAGLLRQVWLNLLSNAVKYSSTQVQPVIDISATQTDGTTVYMIKDNGVGFEMSQAGSLFGVFQRLHGDADFEGTGLGLTLVKRIVNRHGGKIWATARVNEGATFYFTLSN